MIRLIGIVIVLVILLAVLSSVRGLIAEPATSTSVVAATTSLATSNFIAQTTASLLSCVIGLIALVVISAACVIGILAVRYWIEQRDAQTAAQNDLRKSQASAPQVVVPLRMGIPTKRRTSRVATSTIRKWMQ